MLAYNEIFKEVPEKFQGLSYYTIILNEIKVAGNEAELKIIEVDQMEEALSELDPKYPHKISGNKRLKKFKKAFRHLRTEPSVKWIRGNSNNGFVSSDFDSTVKDGQNLTPQTDTLKRYFRKMARNKLDVTSDEYKLREAERFILAKYFDIDKDLYVSFPILEGETLKASVHLIYEKEKEEEVKGNAQGLEAFHDFLISK